MLDMYYLTVPLACLGSYPAHVTLERSILCCRHTTALLVALLRSTRRTNTTICCKRRMYRFVIEGLHSLLRPSIMRFQGNVMMLTRSWLRGVCVGALCLDEWVRLSGRAYLSLAICRLSRIFGIF